LKKLGESVIDIEGLAKHKGSAFGNIGMPKQPAQEMFENLFAHELSAINHQRSTVWIEDESQRIGDLNIPSVFFKFMRTRPVLFLDIPFNERLNHIVQEYGKLEKEKLVNAIIRIQKRLGGVETKNAINHLIEGNIKESFHILLKYYDKWYEKSLISRENWEALVSKYSYNSCDPAANAKAIQAIMKNEKETING